MNIQRAGTQPTNLGPADWFTGTVHVTMLFAAEEPGRVSGGRVTFEPGARTAWHSHPFGQTLVVAEGHGRVQRWGGPIEEIGAGDIVWFPAGEKHWHGASPAESMTHLAIQESEAGSAATWMEHVSDEQYGVEPAAEGAL
jgi:quercetin dioxygenase-like cupin family protein